MKVLFIVEQRYFVFRLQMGESVIEICAQHPFSVFDEELGIATQYTMTKGGLWEFGAGSKKYTTKETEFIDWMYEKSLNTFKVLRGKERQLKEQFDKEKELETTEEKIKCPIN